MIRRIQSIEERYLREALDFVEKVFTDSEGAESGKMVRTFVEEIRRKKYYLPDLEFIMLDETDRIIGYIMFSRFHLQGIYEDKLLLLSPVAVKTELQRQHISKEMIEYGFKKAAESGYEVVLVEGDPKNYNPRGFKTSCDFGIVASPKINLLSKDCLMVKELVEGTIQNYRGEVDFSFYESLA